ncbi:glycosyltransferase [Roseomonas elaeocarpi]|uniref:Glycosyltransferase n=1 Tax=Roseomonas elaeocarpi TaxID=907779 RepID=A0ABV6JYF4_9PROT
MPHCLIITPFPLSAPKHGGQVRAASVAWALRHAGWQVDMAGIFHERFFPPEEWGPHDIVLQGDALADRALGDILFADLHVARAAARQPEVVAQLRRLLARLRPDMVHVEHPWDWLVLRQALPDSGPRPRIVYSSQNIEWSARAPFFRLGMKRPGDDALVLATRALELDFARAADLVFSISDLEAAEIEQESGRPVVYLPAVSDLAQPTSTAGGRFAREAGAAGIRYAATMGSAYWPNVEGFFDVFPQGLGFLAHDEQIWAAGALGRAIHEDKRYNDFRTINETRFRATGYVEDSEKAGFFAAAACVLVPVRIGAGAKLKMADAVASGCAVIATPHAVEGYGPLVAEAIDDGIYVADTPRDYRALVRRALREGLPGCSPAVRARLGLGHMAGIMVGALATLPGLQDH